MVAWPASLPQKPLSSDSWSGGPQRNKVSFKPTLGASIDRRRGSAAGAIYSATFAPLTDAQLATFTAFFEDDLYDGTYSYTWNDPVTGASYSWKFADDDPPYTVKTYRADMHTLSFRVMRLP